MSDVLLGYGPDGLECQPSAPRCVAQARLRDDDQPSHYVRSFGPALADLEYDPKYWEAPFVRVTPRCFELYLIYLRGRRPEQYMAADRHFRA
jgi:hypothetical protein